LTFLQIVSVAFLILLHQEMQQADHMVLIKLESQLILALAEEELDESVLADDWVLPLLLLIVHWN